MSYMLEIMGRTLLEAEYMIETKCTIRETAAQFDVSKTPVHYDLTVRLPEINWELYMKVRKVLNKNKEESSYRGGKAVQANRAKRRAG